VSSNFGPPEAWRGQVPASGSLSFDFVSGVTVGEDAVPVGDHLVLEIINQDVRMNGVLVMVLCCCGVTVSTTHVCLVVQNGTLEAFELKQRAGGSGSRGVRA
jgi:hypothetical protein